MRASGRTPKTKAGIQTDDIQGRYTREQETQRTMLNRWMDIHMPKRAEWSHWSCASTAHSQLFHSLRTLFCRARHSKCSKATPTTYSVSTSTRSRTSLSRARYGREGVLRIDTGGGGKQGEPAAYSDAFVWLPLVAGFWSRSHDSVVSVLHSLFSLLCILYSLFSILWSLSCVHSTLSILYSLYYTLYSSLLCNLRPVCCLFSLCCAFLPLYLLTHVLLLLV